jgi:hypothetical protein
VRFTLFGGEEEGMLGSIAYVRQHMAELPKFDAIVHHGQRITTGEGLVHDGARG